MEFKHITERKESIFIPCVWHDATSNPEQFKDENGKVISFPSLDKATAFMKKQRPLLCRIGIKKFPKVGYVKATSKTDYHILV